ncbi:MAG: MBL fold metallo-hydrolase [Elusimicrobiota bacterium]|jgi:glyoxylase-like metal-dependent hydrolase (beta-lactamase superfamily II)|nr:MBL fold metallo-hydrolase [Elusimicrobiota bacterium]
MKIHTLVLGDMLNCSYIIETGAQALLVDPSWQMQTIYDLLEQNGLKPAAALFTHGHYDHLHGAAELLEKYGIKGYIEESDVLMSALPARLLHIFKGDYKTKLAGLDIEFLHTPGHSRGSVCIKIGEDLFTGDTLFPGGCGRADLPGSNPKDLQNSLERLAHLPPETKVYSGHCYGPGESAQTTIGHEIKTNPFIKLALR